MRAIDAVPDVQLAPMEGVLDWVLRELLSEVGGIDRMVTEFVRVTDRVLPKHVFAKYCPELLQDGHTRTGTPVFIQLLGGQPGPMAESAAVAVSAGALGIDLNFGCPAKTVNRHDGGAALLKIPQRLFDVTQAVRAAVPANVPVSAKVRLGFEHKDFHREIAQAVDEAGAGQIVVHARTKVEMYTPPAHWSFIRSMREGRSLPFLANGDIWNVEDYVRCKNESGVSRVALGRGLVSDPWLALKIRKQAYTENVEDRGTFLWKFFQQSLDYKGEMYVVRRMKQLLRYWAPTDIYWKLCFDRAKVLHRVSEMRELVDQIRKELEWQTSKSTPSPIARTAYAPSTYSIAKA